MTQRRDRTLRVICSGLADSWPQRCSKSAFKSLYAITAYYCILLQRSTSFRTEHERNKLNNVVSCAPLHAKKVLKITLKVNWRVVSVHKHNFFSGGCFCFCKFLNSAFKDNVFLTGYAESCICFLTQKISIAFITQ